MKCGMKCGSFARRLGGVGKRAGIKQSLTSLRTVNGSGNMWEKEATRVTTTTATPDGLQDAVWRIDLKWRKRVRKAVEGIHQAEACREVKERRELAKTVYRMAPDLPTVSDPPAHTQMFELRSQPFELRSQPFELRSQPFELKSQSFEVKSLIDWTQSKVFLL